MRPTNRFLARASLRSVARLPRYFAAGDGMLDSLANAAIAVRRWPETVVYDISFGRLPNYVNPRTYTEKIQWRKMFDRNPELAIWCDKLAARELAKKRAPGILLAKLLWSGTDPDAIPLTELKPPFVIKANNRSGALIFVRTDADLEERRIRSICRGWMQASVHRRRVYEWGYGRVATKIFIEEFISRPGVLESPPDLKVWVFNGNARYVYYRDVLQGRAGVFTREWEQYQWDRWGRMNVVRRIHHHAHVAAPEDLAAIIEAAQQIAAGLDHLRVDLYEIDGAIYFGEGTVYPSSGHKMWIHHNAICDPDPPDDIDREFSTHWDLPAIPKRTMLRRGLSLLW